MTESPSRTPDPGPRAPSLRDLITDGRAHVFDGAMGTMLYARGAFINVCYDELNLRQPELVQDVHRAYVKAGAEIVETNTFGANPVKLAHYSLAEQTEAINRRAAELAVEAVKGRAAVVGAIGPLGIRIEPFGETSRDEAVAHFRRQAAGLAQGGVHGFVLETFGDLDEITQAFTAVRQVSDLPVFAQMTLAEDGQTPYGTDVETLARTLDALGADVIGINCSVGPQGVFEAIERMAKVTATRLIASTTTRVGWSASRSTTGSRRSCPKASRPRRSRSARAGATSSRTGSSSPRSKSCRPGAPTRRR